MKQALCVVAMLVGCGSDEVARADAALVADSSLPLCPGLLPVGSHSAPAPSSGACAMTVPGDPEVFYATCTGDVVVVANCLAPVGAGVCLAGRRTILCRSDADCVSGFRCRWALGVGDVPPSSDFGYCERSCVSDLDCIRCELVCDANLSVCTNQPATPD